MYEPKLEKEIRCPLEYGLDIFGGKWKSRIICILASDGTMRYSAIRKELSNITDAVLAAMLKEMIADEIIDRKQYNEIPPKVEYSLTSKGESVVPILQSICQWSRAYNKIDKENALPPCKKCTQI
jgi:DNA-binding HxlR family transcriptional regulator